MSPGAARIQLRNANSQPTAYGVGTNSSKWSDFLGHTANTVGNSSASPAQPLPVSLLDFTAKKASDGRRVQLDWTTATESGLDYYEIERSGTAGGAYSSIGVRVKSAGSSAVKLSYQSYDGTPLGGMNWYRVRMVDLSGKLSYSDTRSVNFGGGGPGGERIVLS